MLANRREEWYDESAVQPTAIETTAVEKVKVAISQPSRLDFQLRSQCLAIGVLVAVMAMFFTVQSESIVRAGYRLVETKEQAAKVERDNELLRLEIARLKSPQRIQEIAKNQLGMVSPQSVYCAVNTPQKETQPPVRQEKSMVAQLLDLIKNGRPQAHSTS